MKQYITDYTPSEIQNLDPKDVRGLAFSPTRQLYSVYLKICRKFEYDLDMIENRVQNEVRFIKPSSPDEKSMKIAIEQHGQRLEQIRAKYREILVNVAQEIVATEEKLEETGQEFTAYPVRGLDRILNLAEDTEVVDEDDTEEDGEVVDVYQKAEDTLKNIENLLETYSAEEKKELQQKIITPLKVAIKKKNKKVVKAKLKLLEEILDKE